MWGFWSFDVKLYQHIPFRRPDVNTLRATACLVCDSKESKQQFLMFKYTENFRSV